MTTGSDNGISPQSLIQVLRELVLGKLEEAEADVVNTDNNVKAAQALNKLAVEKRDQILKDKEALDRIETYYPPPEKLPPHATDEHKNKGPSNSEGNTDEGVNEQTDDNQETEGDDGGIFATKRKRINIKSKMVELIRATGKAQTLNQIEEMVSKVHGAKAVSLKTLQNRLGELIAGQQLTKTYLSEQTKYVYGLPEWCEHGKLKPEHIGQLMGGQMALPGVINTGVSNEDSV